jgi:hypothetical protein
MQNWRKSPQHLPAVSTVDRHVEFSTLAWIAWQRLSTESPNRISCCVTGDRRRRGCPRTRKSTGLFECCDSTFSWVVGAMPQGTFALM